jgi:hypothetical protein
LLLALVCLSGPSQAGYSVSRGIKLVFPKLRLFAVDTIVWQLCF